MRKLALLVLLVFIGEGASFSQEKGTLEPAPVKELKCEVREEVIERVEEVKNVERTFYVDIYVNGKSFADGIETSSREEAQVSCESFMGVYNTKNVTTYPTKSDSVVQLETVVKK